MVPAAPPAPTPRRAGGLRRAPLRLPVAVAAACLALLVVAVAAWQVGARPKAADDGLPAAPPPLALPSDTPEDSPLARAAARLSAGELELAREGFVDVVAEDQDGVAGQVGLVLSRWRSTGPVSVERDLVQLTREYPESALAALHLGLVQLLLRDERAARATLRTARELGLEQRDATSLRMATLASDLLDPDALRGTMPVLVQPSEVPARHRAQLAAMQRAVAAGDRRRASELASSLARSADAMVQVAAASGTFDKAEPDPTVERLDELASSARADADRATSDRAELMSTLAQLWAGGRRGEACTRLESHARASVDPGTRRLAGPIAAELCAAPGAPRPAPGES